MKILIVLCSFLLLTVQGKASEWNSSNYRPRSVLYTFPDQSDNKVKCCGSSKTWCPETVNLKPENVKPVSPVGKKRIVGGTEVVPNSLPWQAAIFVDDEYFCGGSLISNEWILTAAHCVDNAAYFDILLGAHNIHQDEPDRLEFRSTEYYIHPHWGSNRLRNDVALIKLPEPVTFTDKISPITLASYQEPDHAGNLLHTSGWGKTSDADENISPVLREVEVVGIDNQKCVETYGFLSVNPSNLCTSSENGKSTCNSDSGGPLSFFENERFRQVGIVSFGSRRGCEAGEPSVFSRVSSYVSWISSVTGLNI